MINGFLGNSIPGIVFVFLVCTENILHFGMFGDKARMEENFGFRTQGLGLTFGPEKTGTLVNRDLTRPLRTRRLYSYEEVWSS